MGIWNWLFGEIASPPIAEGPICPFCEQATVEKHLHPSVVSDVWKSQCGAIGSGCGMYPDLDEVADQLLSIVGISGRVSQPITPVGESGMMFGQPYNIPDSLQQLQEILRVRGYAMKASTEETESRLLHSIWIIRRISYYVWAPKDMLAMCQSFLEGNGYSLRKPPLPDDEWKRVDMLFEQVSATLDLSLVVVLSEESAEKTGQFLYIYLEPFADMVIALGYAEKRASITYTDGLWEPALASLSSEAERLLQQHKIIDALLFSIQKVSQIRSEAKERYRASRQSQ